MLTSEQRAARATGIGSSEIAAIIGESPYCTAWDVWLAKTGRAEQHDTSRTRAGHGLEPWIATTAAEQIAGCTKISPGDTRVHPRHAHVVATPDYYALIDDGAASYDALIECKAVGFRVRHHWGVGVPTYVQAQVQWQMEVCDIDRAFVAAHLDGTSVDVLPVDRDRSVASWLIDRATVFWADHVVADVPPDVDGSKAAGQWLRDRTRGMGGEMDCPEDLADTLALLRHRLTEAKRVAREIETHRQSVILAALNGRATSIHTQDGTVRISQRAGTTRWSDVARSMARELGMSAKALDEYASGYRGQPSMQVRLPRSWGADDGDGT